MFLFCMVVKLVLLNSPRNSSLSDPPFTPPHPGISATLTVLYVFSVLKSQVSSLKCHTSSLKTVELQNRCMGPPQKDSV